MVSGEAQELKLPPSIRHSKLDPGSSEENVKLGVVSVVEPLGPESMVVCGAVLSPCQVGSVSAADWVVIRCGEPPVAVAV